MILSCKYLNWFIRLIFSNKQWIRLDWEKEKNGKKVTFVLNKMTLTPDLPIMKKKVYLLTRKKAQHQIM